MSVLVHLTFDQRATQWGVGVEQGHWNLLWFSILLMVSQEVIKVLTVTFILTSFNWLLQHLADSALFS